MELTNPFNANKDLVDYLIEKGVLKAPHLIEAFRAIDRAVFVPEKYKKDSYGDYPIPLGYGATISQPTTVAFMLELLEPKKGEKILDIGAGSGYTTALLAEMVGKKGKIFGVEIIPKLVEGGCKNLAAAGIENATLEQAESFFGIPRKAPFDKILVSAAGREVPKELIDQLKPGGRMVIPIQNSLIVLDKKSDGTTVEYKYPGFAFVPLRDRK